MIFADDLFYAAHYLERLEHLAAHGKLHPKDYEQFRAQQAYFEKAGGLKGVMEWMQKNRKQP